MNSKSLLLTAFLSVSAFAQTRPPTDGTPDVPVSVSGEITLNYNRTVVTVVSPYAANGAYNISVGIDSFVVSESGSWGFRGEGYELDNPGSKVEILINRSEIRKAAANPTAYARAHKLENLDEFNCYNGAGAIVMVTNPNAKPSRYGNCMTWWQ